MKVLGISLDVNLLDKNSAVAKRVIDFGRPLDKYYLLIPSSCNQKVQLADNIFVESLGAANKFLVIFKIYKRIRAILQTEKLDLLTTQDVYFIAPVLIYLSKKFKTKFEAQIHGFEKLGVFRKLLARYSLRQADIIRTVSPKMKQYLVDNFSVNPSKIYIAPVFVDRQRIEDSQTKLELKKNPAEFIFLTVGRLVPIKNIALQIKALKQLNLKNVRLMVVGDGPSRRALETLVAKENLQASVEFVATYANNLPEYYRSVDCLLITSNQEGYCMVVAEAVLADLPVIMTDVGCAGELVENNLNGFVIPVNDLAALVDKMRQVVQNKKLSEAFRTNNVKYKDKILPQAQLSKIILDNWEKIIYKNV
jgi:glycosyltransferase involved in cell wall biosynthesis